LENEDGRISAYRGKGWLDKRSFTEQFEMEKIGGMDM
jgi:hypothetical protein